MERFLRFFDALMPDCPFHTILGIPCPTCGTTRGFMKIMQGRVLEGLAMNPLVFAGGAMLLGYVAVGLVMLSRTGRFPDVVLNPRRLFWFRIFAFTALIGNWAWLIHRGV